MMSHNMPTDPKYLNCWLADPGDIRIDNLLSDDVLLTVIAAATDWYGFDNQWHDDGSCTRTVNPHFSPEGVWFAGSSERAASPGDAIVVAISYPSWDGRKACRWASLMGLRIDEDAPFGWKAVCYAD